MWHLHIAHLQVWAVWFAITQSVVTAAALLRLEFPGDGRGVPKPLLEQACIQVMTDASVHYYGLGTSVVSRNYGLYCSFQHWSFHFSKTQPSKRSNPTLPSVASFLMPQIQATHVIPPTSTSLLRSRAHPCSLQMLWWIPVCSNSNITIHQNIAFL